MRKILTAALVALVVLVSARVFAQGKTHHVVFVVTSPNQADWMMTMGNLANMRKGFAPDAVEVEVVAYGPGLAMLKKDSAVAADIQKLAKDGMVFVACENSMRRMQLTKADLIPEAGTVPSGIVEVVKKQEQGWAYIKAGQ